MFKSANEPCFEAERGEATRSGSVSCGSFGQVGGAEGGGRKRSCYGGRLSISNTVVTSSGRTPSWLGVVVMT